MANKHLESLKFPGLSDIYTMTPEIASEYSSSATYAVGDYAVHSGKLYQCTTAIATAEAWTAGHWTEAKLADDVSQLKEDFTSKVFDSKPLTGYKKGGYTRTGSYDSSPATLASTTASIETGYDYIVIDDDCLGIVVAFGEGQEWYGAQYGDYTLSGGYVSYNFYFSNVINIGYFQRAYPDLQFYLTLKRKNGNALTPSDADEKAILVKHYADTVVDVNKKIDSISPIGFFGLDRKYQIISIGHRGGNADLPENTAPNFIDAARKGMLYVETDIAYTSDNVPVLLHDLTINRTGRNADGGEISASTPISSITYAQALEYDFGIYKGEQYAGTKIMTFEEFIKLCKNLTLTPLIELKRESLNDPDIHTEERVGNLVSIVKTYGMSKNVLWGSFDTDSVCRVLKFEKSAIIGSAFTATEISDAKKLELKVGSLKALKTGANKVFASVNTNNLTTAFLDKMKDEQIPIVEYFVNTSAQALPLADHATTFGGITDYQIDIGKAIRDSIIG